VKWLLSRRCTINTDNIDSIFREAARGGNLEMVKFLTSNYQSGNIYRLRIAIFDGAAEGGNIHILDWARHQGYVTKIGYDYSTKAARSGKLHVLQWMKECELFISEQVAVSAAREGHLNILKWLQEHNPEVFFGNTNDVAMKAARNGHFEVLMWIIKQGFVFSVEQVAEEALRSQCVELMDWAWKHKQFNVASLETLCQSAARSGQFDVLKWLKAHGFPVCTRISSFAAANNHLPVLQWARENGCEWNSSVTKEAALYGNVKVLDWAITNGCPWNQEEVLTAAVRREHIHIIEWARRRGVSFPHSMKRTAEARLQGRSKAFFLKWLAENGCPSKPFFVGWFEEDSNFEKEIASLSRKSWHRNAWLKILLMLGVVPVLVLVEHIIGFL